MKFRKHLRSASIVSLMIVFAISTIAIAPTNADGRGLGHKTFSYKDFYFDGKTRYTTIADLASAVNGLEALVGALVYVDAGLIELLNDRKQIFTVFAPTNAAFEDLLESVLGFEVELSGLSAEDIATQLDTLINDKELVLSILLKHVIVGQFSSQSMLLAQGTAEAADESELIFSVGPSSVGENSGVRVNNATIVVPDIRAKNGAIHVMDEVIE